MRVLFRTMAMHLIEKSKTLSRLDQYESWQAVAVARAIPYAERPCDGRVRPVEHAL